MTKRPYTKPGRLADVLALIQVLAFDPHAHRSESGGSKESGGIRKELGEPSSSPKGWITLAKEHPELFRVSEQGDHPLSLVARHVQPRDESDKRGPLSQEFTNVLIRTAIELHDRQLAAAAWWKQFMPPLLAALIAGGLAIGAQVVALRFSHPVTTGRFVHAGDPYPDAILLDTATGRYCYGDIAGQKNPSNVPSCKDLH
jgi:hypothetical protein